MRAIHLILDLYQCLGQSLRITSNHDRFELMIFKTVLMFVIALFVACMALALYGKARWNAGTTQLLNRLDAAQVKSAPRFYRVKELEGLPAPVKRYFQTVLKDGQPIITAITVQHIGTFNMSATAENWKPFTSTQRVITQRPGFDWDARIKMFPGIAAHIHDAYIAGTGQLNAALFGLIPVASVAGSAELSKGELMRFFAEAVWYPTALLPSQGVQWQAIDAETAVATLTDGDISLSMRFHFGQDGLIDVFRAEARGRLVGDKMTFAPWEGRFWNYADRNGMRIPIEGEVAWVLPDGSKPYYRGLITTLRYDFGAPSDERSKP